MPVALFSSLTRNSCHSSEGSVVDVVHDNPSYDFSERKGNEMTFPCGNIVGLKG